MTIINVDHVSNHTRERSASHSLYLALELGYLLHRDDVASLV